MKALVFAMLFSSMLTTAAEVELTAVTGYSQFGLESLDDNFVAGAAIRTYLVSRLSVEPELLYLHRGRRFGGLGLLLNPNVALDLTRRDRPVTVYAIGAVGYYRYGGSSGMAPSAGVGVRVYLNDRWFVSPQFRFGFAAEPFLHFTAGIGYSLTKGR
jgi:hypothetical protein